MLHNAGPSVQVAAIDDECRSTMADPHDRLSCHTFATCPTIPKCAGGGDQRGVPRNDGRPVRLPRAAAECFTNVQVAAIDDECRSTMADPYDRLVQLQSSTAVEGHPCRKFATGNHESLIARPEAAGAPHLTRRHMHTSRQRRRASPPLRSASPS